MDRTTSAQAYKLYANPKRRRMNIEALTFSLRNFVCYASAHVSLFVWSHTFPLFLADVSGAWYYGFPSVESGFIFYSSVIDFCKTDPTHVGGKSKPQCFPYL
jgi:hypothetical protein